jgi:hypothetical protein
MMDKSKIIVLKNAMCTISCSHDSGHEDNYHLGCGTV